MRISRLLLFAAVLALVPLSCAKKDYSVKGDTVTVKLQAQEIPDQTRNDKAPAQVRLQVLGEKIIRVSATPDRKFNDRKSLVVLPVKAKTPFQVSEEDGLVKVSTSSVTATVDPASGKLKFTNAEGKTLLDPGEGGLMAFTPIEVEGKEAYSTRVVFDSPRMNPSTAWASSRRASSTTRGSTKNCTSTIPR